jgi:hypothetical protein
LLRVALRRGCGLDCGLVAVSFVTAKPPTATTATAASNRGILLPLRRMGGYVSSRADDVVTVAGAKAVSGAGAASGLLRA